MRIALPIITAIFSLISCPIWAATGKSFDSQISKYETPQLLQDNDKAFEARLFLLDNAPAGGRVRVATFVFEYGERVKQLSAHLCAAADRGADVELLVDSKSGDKLGVDGPFDTTKEIKGNEEIYAYLADCGVKVFIHNSIDQYVTFFGTRLPPVFPGVESGHSVSLAKILKFVSTLKTLLSETIKNAVGAGVKSDPKEILDAIQSLALNIFQFSGIAGFENAGDRGYGDDKVESRIGVLTKRYRDLIIDPFWAEMDAKTTKAIVKALRKSLNEHPDLAALNKQIRLYNRLNHRKLFLVESADRKQGCAFIGGRNLGDHYLSNKAGSFYDGDVILCRHHGEADNVFESANESFEDLKVNKADRILGEKKSNKVRQVEGSKKLRGKFDSFYKPGSTAAQGYKLPHFTAPELLVSGWSTPQNDPVRSQLITSIKQETREIYIESAYAEFDREIRSALEAAAKRGVFVQIVTNGLFISDGPSKLIRLTMRPWAERMQAAYPKKFRIAFATLAGGHMIHFKGAGFRCQKVDGSIFRSYMIGSHNFHGRSGYSDKEHMLAWKEEVLPGCADPKDDLIAARVGFYAKNKILAKYPTLYHELRTVTANYKDKKHSDMARGLMRMMYKFDPINNKIHMLHKDELKHFEDLFENGGLHDFLGLML